MSRTTPGQDPDPFVLALTGERTAPGLWHENYWFQRHLVAYEWVRAAAPCGIVLDAGCGEGYGAALLAPGRAGVLALDYDQSTVTHMRRTHPKIPVVQGNLVSLPLLDHCLEGVVSLQTLEHLWDQHAFLAECARVLRPGGLLAVSTPNRLTFSPGLQPGQRPRNPFHTRELAPHELVDLLSAHGTVVTLLGIRHGAAIQEWEATGGALVEAQLARPFPEWDQTLARVVSSVRVDDFTLAEDELDSCLDLLALVSPSLPGTAAARGPSQ